MVNNQMIEESKEEKIKNETENRASSLQIQFTKCRFGNQNLTLNLVGARQTTHLNYIDIFSIEMREKKISLFLNKSTRYIDFDDVNKTHCRRSQNGNLCKYF